MSSKEVLFEVGTSITTDPTFRVVRSETGEIETHYDCTYPSREPGREGVTATRDASGNVTGLSAGGARVGSVCLLHYENDGGFAALPSSAEQIVGDVVLIPANTLKPGDRISVLCFTEDAGTPDAQLRAIRVKMHTTSTITSGVQLTAASSVSATNTKFSIEKSIAILTNTKAISSPAIGPVQGVASINSATIDCTVDQYIGLTIQNSNTLVNHVVYYANLTLEQVQ